MWRYSSTLSLTSAQQLVSDQRHVPTALPKDKNTSTKFAGEWMGPRSVRAGVRYRCSIPEPPSLQRVAIRHSVRPFEQCAHELLCGVIWRISYDWQRRNCQFQHGTYRSIK
jgi:hypothetical protein